ncbi:Vesicle coat protein involved in Golgi to plasma membrane transport [Geosmithia morbida]|uniref:Vesicle coat protein involved in Golgi to plasma membrane transport n=1 Tax=Geosmithia morbida TaxID=1094350 RepID=A0A9P4Z2C5_9HYPO|nr:Vesicle coat protein involved in Golgi to plasma membrane transport [Geosmithia morbida]KAF4126144.1 Vesicle coat protein involved in Golgi to plasma membrane transport [Geosmithia morbida]
MGKTLKLINHLQLALAHYCDIHGPTPLMATEGLPTSCTTCYDDLAARSDTLAKHIPPLSAQRSSPHDVANGVRTLSGSLTNSGPTSAGPRQQSRPEGTLLQTPAENGNALDTPPGSPHQSHPPAPHARRDSSFYRTYDDSVTKKQGPCNNCAMVLPNSSTTASGDEDGSSNNNNNNNVRPTLRTRAPAERVFGTDGQASPPNSQTSSDTDGEREAPCRMRNRKSTPTSVSRTASCSSSSTVSESAPFHVHYVDYTSTHEPLLPNSFSLLRASCLRTLSFETLPRAPTAPPGTASSPLSPTGSFVTTQSAGSAVSGGPIFFGDALAGYTTAYIFRIPDVHARGHKRIYAFLALSTHKERLAMKTFAIVSAAFRELANWIQQLAEAEAERAAETSPLTGALYNGSGVSHATTRPAPLTADRSGSSFLTGGGGFTRRMKGGGGGAAPKARSLPELVGQPDFFIQLHRKFVQLLFEVGVTLNS